MVDIPAAGKNDGAFLDIALLQGARRDSPMVLPWPMAGNPGAILSVSSAWEWQAFILSLSLRPGVPEIVVAKFHRAQMLYFLAWLYFDLIKAGELVALTALELSLRDRYGQKVKNRKGEMRFADLLKCMLKDGLTDEKIPMVRWPLPGGKSYPVMNPAVVGGPRSFRASGL